MTAMLTFPSERYDELRTAVAKVDALAAAVEETYDSTAWPQGSDRKQIERLAHLIGAAREAAEAALVVVDAMNADLFEVH